MNNNRKMIDTSGSRSLNFTVDNMDNEKLYAIEKNVKSFFAEFIPNCSLEIDHHLNNMGFMVFKIVNAGILTLEDKQRLNFKYKGIEYINEGKSIKFPINVSFQMTRNNVQNTSSSINGMFDSIITPLAFVCVLFFCLYICYIC